MGGSLAPSVVADEKTVYRPLLDEEAQASLPPLPNAKSHEQVVLESYAADKRLCGYVDCKEVKMQARLAGPMIFVNVLQFSLQLISVMFVGHQGELALSSASIASSFSTVTGTSVLLGMGSALDTLCGQAFGAKQYRLLGIHLQRAVVVLNISAVPLSFIWASIGKILSALGQDPEISMKAGEYARWLIPMLFAYASGQPLIKFLQTQSLVVPLVFSSFLTLCCHVPICWLMVYKSGMGFRGAALASSISNWIYVGLMMIYVRYSKTCEKTRTPFSWEALHDLTGFFKLAIPSAGMVCLEWWSYEVLVLLSGLLPNPELETSTLSICLSTASLAYMFPYGLSAAASTRVSNELGAGNAQAARGAVLVGLGLALIEAFTVSITLLLVRNVWGAAYSSDKEVLDYVASLMPLLAGSTFLDGLQAVLSGVARGGGWQKAGAYINLGSYYIVGLPAGFLLAFVLHFRGRGLWMGITCGSLVQFVALGSITWTINWDKEAKKAEDLVNASLSPTQRPYQPLEY